MICAQSKPDADTRLDKNVERSSETPLGCIRILINVVLCWQSRAGLGGKADESWDEAFAREGASIAQVEMVTRTDVHKTNVTSKYG